MRPVIDIVGAVRTIRSESRIPPGVELTVTIKPGALATAEIIGAAASLIGTLSRSRVTITPDATRPPQSAHALAGDAEVYVHLAGVVDLAAERTRLLKEIDKTKKEIAFLEGKLSRADFVERAPAEVVERERTRLAEQRQILEKLSSAAAALE
jgi:valyl-tRNA synthetase